MVVMVVDVLAAVRGWVNGSSMVGRGSSLAGGVHLVEPRSPSSGAVARVELLAPRDHDEAWDTARVSFTVKAVGGDGGALRVADRAARDLARFLGANDGGGAAVTLDDGTVVRIVAVADLEGPTQAGDLGGEVSYRLDATIITSTL